MDYSIKILEKNICGMSESYLKLTNDAIQAKRGRNVEKYREQYEDAKKLYQYIHYYIYDLNSQQFISNVNTYEKLQEAIKYMEISSSAIMLVVMAIGIIVLTFITQQTVEPLKQLADVACLVGQGNFHVTVPLPQSKDEIGIVTGAFNKMVQSLEEYMRKTRESMEKELLMEAHLKEAQLKFFQSQINPHFLFNSLNAGAQLAMIENAEKTCLFIEKMADFFRYNVKKTLEDADLKEEIEAVDNYVYILNVRFAGDIEYKKEGKSYSLITVKEIIEQYNIAGKLNFLIGTDAFNKIDTWYKADEFRKLVHFIVFPRGISVKDKSDWDYEMAPMNFLDISSTDIRKRHNNTIKEVKDYIEQNDLYV